MASASSPENASKCSRDSTRECRMLEELLEVARVGYWDFELESGKLYLSPVCKRMFGRPEDEPPGEIGWWLDRIIRADLNLVNQNFGRHAATEGRVPFCGQARCRHSDGSIVSFSYSGRVTEWLEPGRPRRIVGCLLDMTVQQRTEQALRWSEARLHAITEQAPFGLFETDGAGRCIFVSPGWCELFGLDAEKAFGDGWIEGVHPDDRDALLAAWRESVQCGATWMREFRLRRPDGRVVWVLGTGFAVRDEWGQISGYIGTNFDISSRKAAEAERERLLEELEHQRGRLRALSARLSQTSEVERSRLALELHDEVGGSLAALGVSLALLRGEIGRNDGEALARRLDDLDGMVRHIGQIVRDVSDAMRPPLLEEFGLAAALKDFAQKQAARGGIVISLRVTGADRRRPPLQVETALYRVGQEAITNVLKHAAAARIDLSVEQAPQLIRLVVRDDGRGFDLVRARTTTGLGLLGMNERLELVGGWLRVESRPGEGTQVLAEVPG